jgi:hypothetical protein
MNEDDMRMAKERLYSKERKRGRALAIPKEVTAEKPWRNRKATQRKVGTAHSSKLGSWVVVELKPQPQSKLGSPGDKRLAVLATG